MSDSLEDVNDELQRRAGVIRSAAEGLPVEWENLLLMAKLGGVRNGVEALRAGIARDGDGVDLLAVCKEAGIRVVHDTELLVFAAGLDEEHALQLIEATVGGHDVFAHGVLPERSRELYTPTQMLKRMDHSLTIPLTSGAGFG